MIAIGKKQDAVVTEKQPDCCTALRGRKNLVAQTNLMMADPAN